MAARKTSLQTALGFVKSYAGQAAFSSFVGQEITAWSAFVYLVELWAHSDDAGRQHAIQAMKSTLAAVRPTYDIHYAFVLTIPAIGDWGFANEIWPELGGSMEPLVTLQDDALHGPSQSRRSL